MKRITYSDMGAIKIFNDTMSCFFHNGFGDGENRVDIHSRMRTPIKKTWEFLGHFTIKTEGYLSQYDCSDAGIYTFSRGRWFVYLKEPMRFVIVKEDMDIHA